VESTLIALPPEPFTVTLKLVESPRDPLTPARVKEYRPGSVFEAAVMVIMACPVTGFGVNVADRPAGHEGALNVTGELNPFMAEYVTGTFERLVPFVRVCEAGACSVKYCELT
jgi:hypothetical protein